MADDLKLYEVNIGGRVHTMRLSAEDAARYGDDAVEAKAKAAPANKAKAPANKAKS
jgi:hypothetical protein